MNVLPLRNVAGKSEWDRDSLILPLFWAEDASIYGSLSPPKTTNNNTIEIKGQDTR